jgi:hypothetical protein
MPTLDTARLRRLATSASGMVPSNFFFFARPRLEVGLRASLLPRLLRFEACVQTVRFV